MADNTEDNVVSPDDADNAAVNGAENAPAQEAAQPSNDSGPVVPLSPAATQTPAGFPPPQAPGEAPSANQQALPIVGPEPYVAPQPGAPHVYAQEAALVYGSGSEEASNGYTGGYGYATGPVTRPQPRKKVRVPRWLVLSLGIVVVVAAGVGAGFLYVSQRSDAVDSAHAEAKASLDAELFGPETLVDEYLTALEEGDAEQAWLLASGQANPAEQSSKDYTVTFPETGQLINNEIYTEIPDRPSDPSVDSVRIASSGRAASVKVSYDLDGERVHVTYAMKRADTIDDGYSVWAFAEAPTVTIEWSDKRTYLYVGGVNVTALKPSTTSLQLVALPGVYQMSACDEAECADNGPGNDLEMVATGETKTVKQVRARGGSATPSPTTTPEPTPSPIPEPSVTPQPGVTLTPTPGNGATVLPGPRI